MDLNEYRKKCSNASTKLAIYGTWWAVKWDEKDLVKYNGSVYIPFAIRLDYKKGEEVKVAILHDLKSNTEYNALLKDVTENV